MEKYQLLQNIFGWLSLVFTISAAVCGFIWNYYGGAIDDLRSDQQKSATEHTAGFIKEEIDSSSKRLSKEIHKISTKPVVHKSETTVNAPNAQNVVIGDKNIVGNTINVAEQRIVLTEADKIFFDTKVSEELEKNHLDKKSVIRLTAVQDRKAIDVAEQLNSYLTGQGYTIGGIASIAASFPVHKKIRIYYSRVDKAVTIDVGFFTE